MKLKGAIFDLDGVISKTEKVHAIAWKELFDDLLKNLSRANNGLFVEFDKEYDYLTYVDGKPRLDGIKSFLKSRNIELPNGDLSSSDENLSTVVGLGNKKDKIFNNYLDKGGVEVYDSTKSLISSLRSEGIKLFVASSSKNCRKILKITGLFDMFEAIYDGTDLIKDNIPGKPEPYLFLNVIKGHDLDINNTVVFEDAVSGVQSAKAGGFYTIGISRSNNTFELRKAGADLVVDDLQELHFSVTEGLIKK